MAQKDFESHPWWRHVPSDQRSMRIQTARRHDFKQVFRRRPVRIACLILIYVSACLLLLLLGGISLTVMGLTPLILPPAVGGLAWWLTWKEFHH